MGRRLGRGLGSLLGESTDQAGLQEIPPDRISPNPFQPRELFDASGLEELEQSLKNHGMLQPVVVRRTAAGFELVSGERRWRAAKAIGLEQIPAIIRDNVSDPEMLELALVENLQRRDLNPIERARGFQAMLDSLSLTQEGVAARVGLKRTSVTNHLRLLDLPQEAQEALSKGLVNMGHARALLGLRDREAILELLELAIRKELSVRDVERLVRESVAPASQPEGKSDVSPAGAPSSPPAWIAELERRMRETLGTKVSVQPTAEDRGRIVVEYFSRDGLDRICEVLAPRETI